MRRFNRFYSFLFVLSGLILIKESSADSKFETWTEKMSCGNSQFTLKSICRKSSEEFTLNECKSQTLGIQQNNRERQINLPELNKFSARIIKETGGDIKNLFVTQWACVKSGGKNIMVLRYSTGGGSAPYSESEAIYDESGNIVKETDDPRDKKALIDTDRKLKAVRSIMPE